MKAIYPCIPKLVGSAGVAAALALGSCSAPRTAPVHVPPSAPAPRPAPPPLTRAPADWRDAAQTPGDWTWAAEGGLSVARFGPQNGQSLVTITCDRAAGQVLLARRAASTGAIPMQITTTTTSQALISEPLRSSSGWLVAPLRARDPLLDAIAFSRGRFAFEAAGEATLYLPSWPEIGRAIQDCR